MSSGFISESEILEARRRRQEEWDKVRTEDQPKEAPEESYDSRPLFQRLEEQRLKKDAEYEEAHKLKNMIRGLDDDEVGFLDLVERTKAEVAQQISIEEKKEMQEFRERVSSLAESEELSRLRAQLAPARTAATTAQPQKNKLQGVVVRKRKASEMDSDKQEQEKSSSPPKNGVVNNKSGDQKMSPIPGETMGALQCVGVLPGLGHYDTDTSSDSDDSSDNDSKTSIHGEMMGKQCVSVLTGLRHFESHDSSDNDSSDKCCVKRDLLGRRPEQTAEGKRKEEEKS